MMMLFQPALPIVTDFTASDFQRFAKNRDPWEMRPFIAIAHILSGMSRRKAALKVGATPGDLAKWIRLLNAKGVEGLKSRPCRQRVRRDISAAELRRIAGSADERARRRILAMADLVEGAQQKDIAKRLKIAKSTVSSWLRRYNRSGVAGLIEVWKGSFEMRDPVQIRRDISANDVRRASALAQGRAAARLAVIAHVLEGTAPACAARIVGVENGRVRDWIRRFNAEGIGGFRNHRPRLSRVTLEIRQDIPGDTLRRAARYASETAKDRLLGVADVLDGLGRLESARKRGLSPSAMTHWIHRFNEKGIDGLSESRVPVAHHTQQSARIGRKRGRPVTIRLQGDFRAEQLRNAAKHVDRKAKRKLMALAHLVDGLSPADTAKRAGVTRQTVCSWIKWLNANEEMVRPVS